MIEFHCPHCDKALKTSPDRAGLQAKCPGCGEAVVVPTEPQATILDFPDEIDVRCPACQEPIHANQTRCSLCGAAFERDELHPEKLSRRRETRPFPPGEVINEALRIYSRHWMLLTAAFLVKVVLAVLPVLILLGMFAALTLQFRDVRGGDADDPVLAIAIASTVVVFSLIALALSTFLHAGSLLLHLKVAREQPASVSDLFSGGPYWRRMTICAVVVNLLIGLGCLACFVPGLLLQAVFLPYGYILVAENRSSMDCLSRTREMTNGNWGSLLLIALLAFGFYYAGSIPCYIGMIFAIPFVDLLYALAYERMLQQTPLNKINSN